MACLAEQALFRNMTSMLFMYARYLRRLETVPEKFFAGLPQLMLIFFTSSVNLGRRTPLPDGMLRGLRSLVFLSFAYNPHRNLPNMTDLVALQVFYAFGAGGGTRGAVHFDDAESEAKFDGLASVGVICLQSQSLTRIPSLKNTGKLSELSLIGNLITMIRPGDFKGATSLIALKLGHNHIVSTASEAFDDLLAMRVLPQVFNPENADGSPCVSSSSWRCLSARCPHPSLCLRAPCPTSARVAATMRSHHVLSIGIM